MGFYGVAEAPFVPSEAQVVAISLLIDAEAEAIAREAEISYSVLREAYSKGSIAINPLGLLRKSDAAERLAVEQVDECPQFSISLLGTAKAYDELFRREIGFAMLLGA